MSYFSYLALIPALIAVALGTIAGALSNRDSTNGGTAGEIPYASDGGAWRDLGSGGVVLGHGSEREGPAPDAPSHAPPTAGDAGWSVTRAPVRVDRPSRPAPVVRPAREVGRADAGVRWRGDGGAWH